MVVLYCFLGLIALLLLVVLVRTAMFRPKKDMAAETVPVEFDRDAAVRALQKLIQCRTVSYYDHALEDDEAFEKLIGLLPVLYPTVWEKCALTRLPDRGLLFCWHGKKQDAPAVMMAHYDVVPVEEENWEKPPFAGIIEDGVLWGRGSLDTKVTFNGILSAAEHLLQEGFEPEQDIYFAFSGGEEVNGEGAVHIVNWFAEHHVQPALVVDEGGAVVENVFPGVKVPCGLIGIAEKGMMNLTLSVSSAGGHASAPKPHTPIGILSKACCRLEDTPFPMRLSKPAAEMFDTLGRHSTFLFRMIFANLWLFSGAIDLLGKKVRRRDQCTDPDYGGVHPGKRQQSAQRDSSQSGDDGQPPFVSCRFRGRCCFADPQGDRGRFCDTDGRQPYGTQSRFRNGLSGMG